MPAPIRHIFYVDDDDDDHFFFTHSVSAMSPPLQITSFYRCDDVLNRLNDISRPLPDLIFLDYNMGVISGIECLMEIKKMAHATHIPIIMYSTSHHGPCVQKSLECGAYRYIVKKETVSQTREMMIAIIEHLSHEDRYL